MLAVGVVLWTACEPSTSRDLDPPQVTLAEASEQVTFASTEALGPHRFVSTWERTEFRSGSEVSHHQEVTEIRWQDWDHFVYRRQVDDRSVEDVVVYHGQAWIARGEQWRSVDDAEPYRTQLRMTWNTWEQVSAMFGDALSLTPEGVETIEERATRRYTVQLSESLSLERTGPQAGNQLKPQKLDGSLWVDEATAVRLIGRLNGVLQRSNYTQEHTLRLARTNIGASQDIQPPNLVGDQEQ